MYDGFVSSRHQNLYRGNHSSHRSWAMRKAFNPGKNIYPWWKQLERTSERSRFECVPNTLLIHSKRIDVPPVFQRLERKSGTLVPGAQSSIRLVRISLQAYRKLPKKLEVAIGQLRRKRGWEGVSLKVAYLC